MATCEEACETLTDLREEACETLTDLDGSGVACVHIFPESHAVFCVQGGLLAFDEATAAVSVDSVTNPNPCVAI